MRREGDLKRVIELITWWVLQVKSNNYVEFFDINRVSENLALKLLNEIYGYHLENLNNTKVNYPGIDLGDKTNKIGFQITSRRDSKKFKESLEKFSKGPHEIYSNGIRFLILSQDKKPGLSEKKYAKIYPGFDPDNHILTINDLIKGIHSKYDTDRIVFNKIKNILEEEIARKYLNDRDSVPCYPGMKWFPGLHRLLARIGISTEPPELVEIRKYLRELHSEIENNMREKTYLPLSGKQLPSTSPLVNELNKDPFVSPIHQVILQLLGQSKGGDSASAQISAVNRRSRVVRNILRLINYSEAPLILLGDPGSGKTMTLQQAVLTLAKKESHRIFPRIPIYVRLGEFHVEWKKVTADDVREYVKQSVPLSIRNRIDELEQNGRLVIFFDGMDEMSRERYSEHTEALSIFAGGTMAKTLFSCRITDFSPTFIHQRLVLLPFNKNQVDEYLDKYIMHFPIRIDGISWNRSELARYIIRSELPIEANNPFVLWLLCLYLQLKETWPFSRVELLRFYNEQNYQRKNLERPQGEPPFPDMNCAFRQWARFAYTITKRNRGPAIPVRLLQEGYNFEEIHEMILTGKKCGVLTESRDKHDEHLVRFEHHRFQEFFAAFYIHENKPAIDWLNKLDAPRWQETMLNLILLGEADNVVDTFASTIEEQTGICQAEIAEIERRREEYKILKEEEKKKKEEKPKDEGQPDQDEKKEVLKEPELILSYEHESVLADRVELSSRILHQTGSGFPKVQDTIMPIFEKAVGFLANYGSPITQVKMMRACQNVPGIDFIEALLKPLNSTIHWVRNQALIVIGSSQAGARAVGADLPTEIGLDLANGVLPLRLPAYWKAVRSAGNRGYWWSLLMGAFCYLTNVLLLLAASGIIYAGMRSLGNKPNIIGLPGFSILSHPISIAIFVFLVLLAAGITLRIRPSLLWIGILGSVFLIGPLIPVLFDLWMGHWKGLGTLLLDYLLLGFMAVFFISTLIAIPIHLSLLTLYLVLTARLRHCRHYFKIFFIGMLKNCRFGNGLKFGLIGTIGYVILWSIGLWLHKFDEKSSNPLLAAILPLFIVLGFVGELSESFAGLGFVGSIKRVLLIIFGLSVGIAVYLMFYNLLGKLLNPWIIGIVTIFVTAFLGLLIYTWNKKGFTYMLKFTGILLVSLIGIGILVIACFLFGLLLNNFLHFGKSPGWTGFIAIICMSFVGGIIYHWTKKGFIHILKVAGISLVSLLGVGILVIAYFWLGQSLNNFLHLGISPWWTGAIAVICMPLIGGLIYHLIKKGFVFILKSIGIILLGFIIFSLIIADLLDNNSFITARILVLVAGIVLVYILVFNFRPLWYAMKRFRFFSLQKFPLNKFKPEVWTEIIEKSDPVKQNYLLFQTDQQLLSLTAAEFLEVLKEIRPLIKEEPALSAYWEKRDRLEEALRQERQG